MEFEYDPAKSQTNAQKHGIDFEQAKALWADRPYVEYELPYPGERRFVRIAGLGETRPKLWVVIFTIRGTKIRIISARRAGRRERAVYEKDKAQDR